ncbi:MAG: hypothetical protein WBP45_15820 [Daejeonella sp.]
MKKIFYITTVSFFFALQLFAQEKQIQGIVFDKSTKQRLSRVYIYNLRTSKGFYNNTKGEFASSAQVGDILIAALQGYAVDTLSVNAQNIVLFYLKRTSIQLQEVLIRDTINSPKSKLEQIRKDYKDAYAKGNTNNALIPGGSNGSGGAGLSISMLYNLLSREGKNARQLQRIIERDYHESMIDYRYTKTLVGHVTGLSDEILIDFMQQYRPSFNFIIEANDYELINFIKSVYQRYIKNPAAYRLVPLKP